MKADDKMDKANDQERIGFRRTNSELPGSATGMSGADWSPWTKVCEVVHQGKHFTWSTKERLCIESTMNRVKAARGRGSRTTVACTYSPVGSQKHHPVVPAMYGYIGVIALGICL
jgi:hypothetical protein